MSAILDIFDERKRQNEIWGEQNHDPFVWVSILVEEVGELAEAALKANFGNGNTDKIREEAIHAAAVAIQFIECLDRNSGDIK